MPDISILPPNPMAPPTTGQGIGSALGMMMQALPQGIQAALEHRMRKEQLELERQRTQDYGEYFKGQNERWVEQNRLSAEEANRQEVETGLEYLAAGSKTLRSASPDFQAKVKKYHPEIDLDFDLGKLQKESDAIKMFKAQEDYITRHGLPEESMFWGRPPEAKPTGMGEREIAELAAELLQNMNVDPKQVTQAYDSLVKALRVLYGLAPAPEPLPAPGQVPVPPYELPTGELEVPISPLGAPGFGGPAQGGLPYNDILRMMSTPSRVGG